MDEELKKVMLDALEMVKPGIETLDDGTHDMLPTGVGIDSAGTMYIMALMWENNKQGKYDMINSLKPVIREKGIKTWVFISTAWSRSQNKEEPIDKTKAVSEYPDKREVVIILGRTASSSLAMMCPFKKNGELDEPEIMERYEDNLWGDLFRDMH